MDGKNNWIPVSERLPEDRPFRPSDEDMVDVWMAIYSSPLSMGMSDAFRVPNAWRQDGKWVHVDNYQVKELESRYITHWRPVPDPPKEEK